MKVSIVGLGFVGGIAGVCLCDMGHEVIGVDRDRAKVDLFAGSRAPIIEPGIEELFARAGRTGRLRGTTSLQEAVARTDLTFVCVGTLQAADGGQDISSVEDVARELGAAIVAKRAFHSVAVRSTVLPGTTRGRICQLIEQASGGRLGIDFGLAYNPDFTREGSAVADFRTSSRVVIGEIDRETADRLEQVYSPLASRVFRTSAETAEMVKYTDNTWHALKVAFANEVGALSGASGADADEVMAIFAADRTLNISAAYLKPGFAYGGPCLPKDVAVLNHWSKAQGVPLPLIGSIATSNELVVARSVTSIFATGRRRIALFGLSHKSGTCDLRGSPFVRLAEQLREAGCTVRAYDPAVSIARRNPAHHDYTDAIVDGLDQMLIEDRAALVAWSDLVVVTSRNYSEEIDKASRKIVIDLTGSPKKEAASRIPGGDPER